MPTCDKCSQYFPNWVVIEGKPHNLCSRRFCLDCSPFGTHNTKDLTVPRTNELDVPRSGHCLRCRIEINHTNAYTRSGKSYLLSYCRDCFNHNAHERQKKIKRQCIEYKGGGCSICGYNRCIQALEFHHLESELKEKHVSGMKSRSFERIKIELDKCLLVCCLCHREIHAGLIQVPAISAVAE